MRLIGVTGTLGAGKGTVAAYLKGKGFHHYSFREIIAEHVRERGLPVNRDTLLQVANEVRTQHGGDYFFAIMLARARSGGGDAVIESMRVPDGCRALKAAGGVLIAVDADPRIRYERITARGSETDQVSFHKFLDDERREMDVKGDHLSNIAACMALADATVTNNGTVEELHRQIDECLKAI